MADELDTTFKWGCVRCGQLFDEGNFSSLEVARKAHLEKHRRLDLLNGKVTELNSVLIQLADVAYDCELTIEDVLLRLGEMHVATAHTEGGENGHIRV